MQYLRSTNASRTAAQIASATRIPGQEVSRTLLKLQERKLVAKTQSGWRANGPVDSSSWTTGPNADVLTDPQHNPVGARGGGGRANSHATGHLQIDPASRWADFRRLCLYYAECVRLEERACISEFSDKEGKQFITLPGPIDWRAVSSGQRVRLVPDSAFEDFIRQSRGRRGCMTLYLGAPIDVFVGESKSDGSTYRIVSPVLVTPAIATISGGNLEIQPTNLIEINHGWLERRLPNAQKRREFLDEIGLSPNLSEDDEQDDLWTVSGFEETVRLLFSSHRDWWREFADLRNLTQKPPLSEVTESGLRNRAVLMAQPSLKFTKRLHDELHRLAFKVADEDLDRSALTALFPHKSASEDMHRADEVANGRDQLAEYCLLNDAQRSACQQALTQPLTVVTGPPGTGKSLVVSHVLANSVVQGRPALFASRNHQAIEAVEPRLNAMTEPEALILRPSRPFRDQAAQFEWYRGMTLLLSRPHREGVEEERAAALDRLQNALADRTGTESLMSNLLGLEEGLVDAEAKLRRILSEGPPDWMEFVKRKLKAPDRAPILKLLETASSLCTERSSWLLRAITYPLRYLRIRSARQQFRLLMSTMKECLGRHAISPTGEMHLKPDRIRDVCRSWLSVIDLLEASEKSEEIKKRLQSMPNRSDLLDQLRGIKSRVEAATQAFLKIAAESAGSRISPEQREQFAALRAAMRNRPQELNDSTSNSAAAEAFRRAMPELMKHFPLWAVSNLSVAKAVPLAPAVFDLVVIDEASQCDIASVVPLLFRARRAMIVGDPMQLSHVTKINRDTEMRVREQFGVAAFEFERHTFAANSMFELAASSRNGVSVQLQNHYRCHPTIAEFCNSAFYSGTLRVMTDADALFARVGMTRTARAFSWCHVPGDAVSGSRGCHSPAQLDFVLKELTRLAEIRFPGSVGVVTPFRVQADRIRDAVHQRFPSDRLAAWRFLADTADGFQGDERDLVLFSLVGSRDMPQGSAYFLGSTPNRFNVAVSRARVALTVIGDEEWAESCGIPFVTHLLHSCRSGRSASQTACRTDLIGPVWEPRFADVLRSANLPFEQQYPTCGYYLDFALFPAGRKLAIEIDGETYHRAPGGGRRVDDIYRDFVLEAAGWKVLRFWVYQLKEDMDACITRVRAEFAG
ncbi:MAG: AAA family ATPase [Planctomycetia bacterium]|nr:AAA family ATPase [Planctomycetia bacterium]